MNDQDARMLNDVAAIADEAIEEIVRAKGAANDDTAFRDQVRDALTAMGVRMLSAWRAAL